MSGMCRIVVGEGGAAVRDVQAAAGVSLMKALKEAGLDIEAACEGNLACGTCLVHLDGPSFARVPPPAADETDMLDCLDGRRPTSRLACQIVLVPSLGELRLAIAT